MEQERQEGHVRPEAGAQAEVRPMSEVLWDLAPFIGIMLALAIINIAQDH